MTIRNVALVGHGGSGKTSLAEALLHAAGATTRLGRVEDGNTVTDFEPEEVARTASVSLALAPIRWNGTKINVIDTPGYADFVGEVRAALRAADLALFVVSAVDGVEVQTELIWEMAKEEGVARAFFINKLDRERSDYRQVLAEMKDKFGTGVAPVELPIGAAEDLRGVAGVVANHAFLYSGGPRGDEVDIPEEVKGDLDEVRTALVEAVVETDDEMLERYFEGQEPSDEELVAGLRSGISAGTIFPALCGSATKMIGIDRLAELLVRDGPGPFERPVLPFEGDDGFQASADGPVAAYVFKTMADPYVGRISLFRVFSGTIELDATLENAGKGGSGRMHNIFTVLGKEHEDVKKVEAGDIAAVAKLETVAAGDTLRTPGSSVTITPARMPGPTMSVAVFPKTQHDDERLSEALAKIADEDPTVKVERRADTNQTVISGLGDAHLEVTLARMKRRYNVDVRTEVPKVPYRETVSGKADVEGKHKKQSGGRGQFGVAYVKFEPLARGAGFEFVDAIKGGSIPRQFIPAVEKGVKEALERGMMAGFPVVDIQATVYDGKYHAVDSDELSFRMAGIQAVRAAAQDLRPTLLEPIMKMRILVPESYTGDVIGDLNSKRGRVLGMDTAGDVRVINAEAPLAEVQRYTADLRSITGGRGHFEMEFDHYEETPPQEAQKVIAQYKEEQE